MKRREFIALVGGGVAWPLATQAQQQAMPVIGFLGGGSPNTDANRVRAFRQGLSETGFVEGKNVEIDYRWAEGQYERFAAFHPQLLHRLWRCPCCTCSRPLLAQTRSANARR